MLSISGTRINVMMVTGVLSGGLLTGSGCGSGSGAPPADMGLDPALQTLVERADGPPGAVVVVQRGSLIEVHTAGVADVSTQAPIEIDDSMRLASVAKAFSGAAALAMASARSPYR